MNRFLPRLAITTGDPKLDAPFINPPDILTLTNVGEDILDGPPEQWVETLRALTERLGLGAIILPATSVEQVERLIADVVPGLRP